MPHQRLPIIHHPDEAATYPTTERCDILESWNRAEDPDLSIARATVAVGVSTRWHRLAQTTERYVILHGQGRVHVGELPPALVNPGDVVYIPPDCPQRIDNTGDVPLVFLAICNPRFRPDNYQELDDV
ncbi:cupin domain-containing protein [Rhabdochromatium marinum]|uniref:cupin domain-containing protein n=1 Tax=Rhabdochromatium marinum TaxID=48729 RepID=UPI00190312B4|nr:cupin domain-containing protein [Rhabdochromatium marinum]MBK1649756.1 cupin [Rhabdochromatium marinum]